MDNEQIQELKKRGLTLDVNGKVKGFNANYFAEYIGNEYRLIASMHTKARKEFGKNKMKEVS